MAEVKTAKFKKASSQAVSDPKLQNTLEHVMGHFIEARAGAIEEFGDESWDQMRERASSIKKHALENLDYYLDLIDRTIQKNGGHVHFAKDTQEANRIVLDIAKKAEAYLKSTGAVSYTHLTLPTKA